MQPDLSVVVTSLKGARGWAGACGHWPARRMVATASARPYAVLARIAMGTQSEMKIPPRPGK